MNTINAGFAWQTNPVFVMVGEEGFEYILGTFRNF